MTNPTFGTGASVVSAETASTLPSSDTSMAQMWPLTYSSCTTSSDVESNAKNAGPTPGDHGVRGLDVLHVTLPQSLGRSDFGDDQPGQLALRLQLARAQNVHGDGRSGIGGAGGREHCDDDQTDPVRPHERRVYVGPPNGR